VEVESDHFVVKTNAAPSDAERMASELEMLRMAELGSWEGPYDPPARLEVVVLRNRTEFQEFLDPLAQPPPLAYYAWGTRPRVVIGLVLDRDLRWRTVPSLRERQEEWAQAEESRVLRHELAHHLIGQVLLRQPPWLAEGLARYLEATRLGTWQGRPAAAVGLPAWDAWGASRVPAADLFAWRPGERGGRFYDPSWLLVHWLMNRRGAEFTAYQQRLARAEDPAAAWKAAFPDLDPGDGAAMSRLDRELDAYVGARSYTALRIRLPAIEPRWQRRRMPPPEVHALRAELFLQSPFPRADARSAADAENAASLREDPSGLWLALLLRATGQQERALALGRAAVATHPADWRSWLLLASGLEGGGELARERLEALRRAKALLPDDAWALNEVAWGLFQAGAAGEGLPLAARAAQLAPANASVLDTCGAILADVGRCPEALLAQRRAVDLLGERAAPEAAREIRDRLARIEARCGTAGASP
jgi:tetratricopeptide (TPR) repeat protein